MRITRRLEFDAGHRIPNHQSACRHLHGHRYAIEVTLSGDVISDARDARNGMVMDFSEVKAVAQREVVAQWDHAFLAWKDDRVVLEFLQTLPGHRTVVFEAPPTAEHLAEAAFQKLERVRIYETPNCWADAVRSVR